MTLRGKTMNLNSTTGTNKLSSENIQNKLRNIKCMKWLLNLEYSKQEFIYEDLQIQLYNFCYQNMFQLIVIHHFLSQITDKMNFFINKIGVLNIFQVLFRIHLLKPSLWSNYATEDIVKSIKKCLRKNFSISALIALLIVFKSV